MKIILLAGGGGTRLFPLSRARFPKQFLKVTGDESLFAQTVQRFLAVTAASDLVVITNRMHEHLVKAEFVKGQKGLSVFVHALREVEHLKP